MAKEEVSQLETCKNTLKYKNNYFYETKDIKMTNPEIINQFKSEVKAKEEIKSPLFLLIILFFSSYPFL